MNQPWAFLNGRMIPAAELAIPAYDAGFVLGATVSEQLRTFGGKLFELEKHVARLRRGLEITTIDAGCTTDQLATWAHELVAANFQELDPADDLGLSIFVTPGPYATLAPPDVPRRATIGMSTYPLPFHMWAGKYEAGEHLMTSSVRQVSTDSWPRELKCRSRMHYYLAEKEVRRQSHDARPLLLDEMGFVNETPTANVVGYRHDQNVVRGGMSLVVPVPSNVLFGVSQAVVTRLAKEQGIAPSSTGNNFRPHELAERAAELWLTSTPFCLLPVVKLDDAPIGDGRPGAMYRKLLAAWSEEVGVDIVEQARRFSHR